MGRKVVDGGPIRFKDDLPIVAAAIGAPLALPPIPILPDTFSVWYGARFYELGRAPGPWYAKVWSRTYGLVEAEPARAREERYAARPEVGEAVERWLRGVVPGGDLPRQVAAVVRERLEEPPARPARPPMPEVGREPARPAAEESVLADLSGYERVLLLDGKVYELLSLAEYLARFQKAFEPAFLKALQEECATATPAAICERMRQNLDRVDKKTFGVIKGKVHHDERTFELHLDGVFFVPEYLGPVDELVSPYRALLETRLKMRRLTG